MGAGKSTAQRKLRHSLNPSTHRFLDLARSSLTPRDLYRELLSQLGVQPRWLNADAQRLFNEKVLDCADKTMSSRWWSPSCFELAVCSSFSLFVNVILGLIPDYEM